MTAPSAHATQWRAFVGPPARRDDDSAFWNWASALTLDAAYSPTTAIPPTVLGTGFNITGGLPAVIHFDNVSAWPSAGGCWIGPGSGAGEIWAYVEFDSLNTGTGYANIVRFDTVDAEYPGTHTISGATVPAVHFWWPITTDSGVLNVREYIEGNLNGGNWRATLRGYNAPLHALRIGHLFLVQTRTYNFGTSAWGDWVNSFVGWIDGVKSSDNADGEERWDIEIVSSMGAYGLMEVAGVKVGASEISRSATASASSALTAVYKVFGSGEFVGAAANVGASNAIDTKTATPWISDKYIGLANTPANPGETFDGIGATAKVLISQVHVTRYPGQQDGYRWIELTVLASGLGNVYITSTGVVGTAPDEYVQDYTAAYNFGGYSVGDRIIVAENPTLFEQENPNHGAADVLEGGATTLVATHFRISTNGATAGTFQLTDTSRVGTADSNVINWNDSASAVGAAIQAIGDFGDLHTYGGPLNSADVYVVGHTDDGTYYKDKDFISIKAGWSLNATPTLTKIVSGNNGLNSPAGSLTSTQWFDTMNPAGGLLTAHDGIMLPVSTVRWGTFALEPGAGFGGLWTGSNVTAVTGSDTMRYIYDPASPSAPIDYWEVGSVHTPGYNPNGVEWVLLSLPGMGLSLAADASGGATSLTIQSDAGAVSVDGLPATGTVQIGSEQIAYTSINRTTGVISGFTTTAAHSEGDPVYVVVGGVAIDALPLSSIAVKRLASMPEVEDMVIRLSPYQTTRTPDDSGYTIDFPTSVTVTAESGTNYSTATVGDNYVGTWDVSGSTPRTRWVLIEVTKMATQPYRAAIHEVEITYDTSVFDTSTYLSGVTIGETMTALLDAAGFPSAGYSDSATTDVDGYTTEPGALWPVLLDLADFGNKRITVGRDSKITIVDDTLLTPASADMDSELPSEAAQLTKDNTTYHEFNFINGRKVGQVELQWKSPDGDSEGTEKYPTTRDTFGSTEVLGPHIYASATAASYAAKRRYLLARRPHAALWEIAGDGSAHKALRVYGGTWPWTYRTMDRTYLSVGADHELSDGAWSTVVQTIQVSREDEL